LDADRELVFAADFGDAGLAVLAVLVVFVGPCPALAAAFGALVAAVGFDAAFVVALAGRLPFDPVLVAIADPPLAVTELGRLRAESTA
jgi:hypothetical protein